MNILKEKLLTYIKIVTTNADPVLLVSLKFRDVTVIADARDCCSS